MRKRYHMDTSATLVQTTLRLPKELMDRVKRNAAREHRSFNSYVEMVLDRATELKFPKLPPDYQVSEEIKSMAASVPMRKFTKDELDQDPKLAYFAEKYDL